MPINTSTICRWIGKQVLLGIEFSGILSSDSILAWKFTHGGKGMNVVKDCLGNFETSRYIWYGCVGRMKSCSWKPVLELELRWYEPFGNLVLVYMKWYMMQYGRDRDDVFNLCWRITLHCICFCKTVHAYSIALILKRNNKSCNCFLLLWLLYLSAKQHALCNDYDIFSVLWDYVFIVCITFLLHLDVLLMLLLITAVYLYIIYNISCNVIFFIHVIFCNENNH